MIKYRLLGVLVAAQLAGCGYSLKNSTNPLSEREGIRKIYVAPVQNSSFTPGVEHLVYNALIKNISAEGRLQIVRSPEDADAVLSGSVGTVASRASATIASQNLVPKELNGHSGDLTGEYVAVLGCSFSLSHTDLKPPPKGKRGNVWSASFSRTAPFPASTRLGVTGTTDALIDDSELNRVLRQLADTIGQDAAESMTSVF